IQRYVPARVYLADPLPDRMMIQEITGALESLLKTEQLQKADELPEESGSFWQTLWFKTTGFFSRTDVQHRLQKAERAIEVAYLDKPQAEANEHQAKAASELIHALEKTSSACVQVGSLLVVKATGPDGKCGIVARTLTHTELRRIEENTEILRRPDEILAWLHTAPQLPVASG